MLVVGGSVLAGSVTAGAEVDVAELAGGAAVEAELHAASSRLTTIVRLTLGQQDTVKGIQQQ